MYNIKDLDNKERAAGVGQMCFSRETNYREAL